jgi:hypothetical protein
VETLLSTSPSSLDSGTLLESLPALLRDDEGIRLQAYKVLVRLCQLSPVLIGSRIDLLVEPLTKTLFAKIPESKKGPELERSLDVLRSCVRTVMLVDALPDISSNQKWIELIENLKRNSITSEFYEALKAGK